MLLQLDREERLAMPLDSGLATAILDSLEIGIVVWRPSTRTVVWSNHLGRAATRAIRSRASALPEPVAGLVEAAAAVGAGRFGPAVAVPAANGKRYYVRAKLHARDSDDVLLTFSAALPRERDISTLLHERYQLCARDCRMVSLLRLGFRNEQIANQMHLSLGTVKQYLHRIFTTLNVRSRGELVATLDRLLESAAA